MIICSLIDTSTGCDNNETCDTAINQQLEDLLINNKRYVFTIHAYLNKNKDYFIFLK